MDFENAFEVLPTNLHPLETALPKIVYLRK